MGFIFEVLNNAEDILKMLNILLILLSQYGLSFFLVFFKAFSHFISKFEWCDFGIAIKGSIWLSNSLLQNLSHQASAAAARCFAGGLLHAHYDRNFKHFVKKL